MMSAKDKKKDSQVPRLRFPEFLNAEEWVRKKVHQIAKIYKGKGISKADISRSYIKNIFTSRQFIFE